MSEAGKKDRAAPFSAKHKRYWIPVTGGMILIGAVNLGLGWWLKPEPKPEAPRVLPTIPPSRGDDMATLTPPVDAPPPPPDATP